MKMTKMMIDRISLESLPDVEGLDKKFTQVMIMMRTNIAALIAYILLCGSSFPIHAEQFTLLNLNGSIYL